MKITELNEQLSEELTLIIAHTSKVNEAQFFKNSSDVKWSMAENLHHLSLSLLPINNLFKQPELMLKRWGHSNRKSRDFSTFIGDYKKAVANADWKAFPPFIPKKVNEKDDYLQQHATTTQSKLNEFYQYAGVEIEGLREKIQLDSNYSKSDVVHLFQSQYANFFMLSGQLSEKQLDECQIPLPYAGLITCREMIYFTYNHTKVHRLAVERILISNQI